MINRYIILIQISCTYWVLMTQSERRGGVMFFPINSLYWKSEYGRDVSWDASVLESTSVWKCVCHHDTAAQ